jgi:hypothetical protein
VLDTRLGATNAANKKVNLDRVVDFKPLYPFSVATR